MVEEAVFLRGGGFFLCPDGFICPNNSCCLTKSSTIHYKTGLPFNYTLLEISMTDSQDQAAPVLPLFVDGEIQGVQISRLTSFADERGWLAEIWRSDNDRQPQPVMAYLSMTKLVVVRGPHEHVHQTDMFVFGLNSSFAVFLWDDRNGSLTEGTRQKVIVLKEMPTMVIVPPGVVHAYQNTGNGNGLVLNLPTHLYKGKDRREEVDEIRHEEKKETPYVLW